MEMELLPAELRASLPALYSQEGNSDPTVHVKFFSPYTDWTWFATEGSPEEDDFIFFGYVVASRRSGGTSPSPSSRGPAAAMCPWSSATSPSRPVRSRM